MYKPNFCAECGERIEGPRSFLWTSGRFCAACAPRFRRAQFLLPIVAGATLFGLGLFAGRIARPAPPPLLVERGQLSTVTLPTGAAAEPADVSARPADAPAPKPEPSYGPNGTATERPTEPDEVVSICGARTQKGTPCQRRVRGTGRCWQHKGMPAMIRNTVVN